MTSNHKYECLYCRGPVRKVKKGEHIVPEALGGALTLRKSVSASCNNSFSQIDNELVSRSYLSIAASEVLGKAIWQIWDVATNHDNLLLEAKPNIGSRSTILYPQIVFERSGPQIHGDLEELRQFGASDFFDVLSRAAITSFKYFCGGGEHKLHFERIDHDHSQHFGYRFPPRLFAKSTIQELATCLTKKKIPSLTLRYITTEDRRFALNSLDRWHDQCRFDRFEVVQQTGLATLRCFYIANDALRALAKIAVNLLTHCCTKETANHDNFKEVINVIKGVYGVPKSLFRDNGFVHAADVASIAAQDNAHSFRLLHIAGVWHIYSAFFGGRVGAVIRIPANNCEEWSCANIVAPLRSNKWIVTTSKILQPLKVHVEWQDVERIVPRVSFAEITSQSRRIQKFPPKVK